MPVVRSSPKNCVSVMTTKSHISSYLHIQASDNANLRFEAKCRFESKCPKGNPIISVDKNKDSLSLELRSMGGEIEICFKLLR